MMDKSVLSINYEKKKVNKIFHIQSFIIFTCMKISKQTNGIKVQLIFLTNCFSAWDRTNGISCISDEDTSISSLSFFELKLAAFSILLFMIWKQVG